MVCGQCVGLMALMASIWANERDCSFDMLTCRLLFCCVWTSWHVQFIHFKHLFRVYRKVFSGVRKGSLKSPLYCRTCRLLWRQSKATFACRKWWLSDNNTFTFTQLTFLPACVCYDTCSELHFQNYLRCYMTYTVLVCRSTYQRCYSFWVGFVVLLVFDNTCRYFPN